jgi:hypothetical protein
MTALETRAQRPGTRPRPHRGARVVGYLVAVAINAGLIWVITAVPGWRSLPLLSEEFSRVLGIVTLSLMIAVAINLLFVAYDPPWVKRLGDAVTTGVTVVVLLQLVTVFPFDFGSRWGAWEAPFRVFLLVGCVGALIGVISNLVLLARDRSAGSSP